MCNNNSINSDEKSSVLIDKTKSGKIRPWREKKMANVDYFELLHILELKQGERVGDREELVGYRVSDDADEKPFYRVRFCNCFSPAMCTWRRTPTDRRPRVRIVAAVIKHKP